MGLHRKFLFIFLNLIILNSPLVYGEDDSNEELLTAGELLNSCEEGSIPGSPNEYCMRYLFGYIQHILMLQQAEKSPPIFCINPQITPIQEATDNMIVHLRSQSSRLNEPAQQIVLEGLNKNYPCTGNQI